MAGAKLGIVPALPADSIDRAVAAAAVADVAIVVVGTDGDWETEGVDRDVDAPAGRPGRAGRPGARGGARRRDRGQRRLGGGHAVGPRRRAVLQTWFGGQEMAVALSDVVFGDAEPGGRLPTTVPRRLEDNPSWGNFPAEGGRVRYGEGLLVGYRWYESRGIDVEFPFGHGLSYSTFEIGEPRAVRGHVRVGRTRCGSSVSR